MNRTAIVVMSVINAFLATAAKTMEFVTTPNHAITCRVSITSIYSQLVVEYSVSKVYIVFIAK